MPLESEHVNMWTGTGSGLHIVSFCSIDDSRITYTLLQNNELLILQQDAGEPV